MTAHSGEATHAKKKKKEKGKGEKKEKRETFYAGLVHSRYGSTVVEPGVETGYPIGADELRDVLEDILYYLVEIEWMHFCNFPATASRITIPKSVLDLLSASLDTLCEHLMKYGKILDVSFYYLSLIAELTQSGLGTAEGLDRRFVRSLTLLAHAFLAPHILTAPLPSFIRTSCHKCTSCNAHAKPL